MSPNPSTRPAADGGQGVDRLSRARRARQSTRCPARSRLRGACWHRRDEPPEPPDSRRGASGARRWRPKRCGARRPRIWVTTPPRPQRQRGPETLRRADSVMGLAARRCGQRHSGCRRLPAAAGSARNARSASRATPSDAGGGRPVGSCPRDHRRRRAGARPSALGARGWRRRGCARSRTTSSGARAWRSSRRGYGRSRAGHACARGDYYWSTPTQHHSKNQPRSTPRSYQLRRRLRPPRRPTRLRGGKALTRKLTQPRALEPTEGTLTAA
jgi:hypothetical protein